MFIKINIYLFMFNIVIIKKTKFQILEIKQKYDFVHFQYFTGALLHRSNSRT